MKDANDKCHKMDAAGLPVEVPSETVRPRGGRQ